MTSTSDFTNDRKRLAAEAALEQVVAGQLLGVGTGSTVRHFIDGLARRGLEIAGAVSSSEASTKQLREQGIPVVELDEALARRERLPLYVDGADETTERGELIKGGGGALTREKVIAAASARFVCIVDEAKLVTRLGAFPLPIEVVPMASAHVARELSALGGRPARREGFVTDNGNAILDVAGLSIDDPAALESTIDGIAGVVTCGLFARRRADEILIGTETGVRRINVAR